MIALVILIITALVLLFAGLYHFNKALLPLSLLGILSALVVTILDWNQPKYYFAETLFIDNFSVAFSSLLLVSTGLIFLLSSDYFEKISKNVAEYYALILFALVGALCLISYQNLSMLFIGIEIMSVSLYILAGIRKNDPFSNEAALKYFLMGSFATGFLLFGIALLYGATGTFNIELIAESIREGKILDFSILYGGILMVIIGLSFKVSAAPFHFWAPDVYQGSPALITAFMSTVVKTAGIAAFYKLFATSFIGLEQFWVPVITVIVVITLLVGNFTAAYQLNFKRLLAYSSISNAGYMLIGIVTLAAYSSNAVFFYAAAYSIATIMAFSVLLLIKNKTGNTEIESFSGLGKSNPGLAFALTISMCSLAGIPLTAGFFGKFMIFSSAISQQLVWLIVIAVINSAIGIYYYFKVIKVMYTSESPDSNTISIPAGYKIVLSVGVALVLILGIYPDLLIRLF